MSNHIRIVIADDSPTVRRYLTNLIDESTGMQVVGEAHNGEEAVQKVMQLRPDVVSMDINMPHIDGLEATRQIMVQCPTPVVVVSGLLDNDIELSMDALDAGALAVIPKPPDRKNPQFTTKRDHLLNTLKAMAAVSVVSRKERLQRELESQELIQVNPVPTRRISPEVVVIGASTGGPSALHHLLRDIPDDFPIPILIAQHMPPEFIAGLVNWLSSATTLDVVMAENDMILKRGMVVISPADYHLSIKRHDNHLITRLLEAPGIYRYQPSIDVLLNSVARVCGAAAIGLILTGMGDDGTNGLLAMHDAGAYTLAQDQHSSTVFGMPNAAIEAGAVQTVVALADLPSKLMKLL